MTLHLSALDWLHLMLHYMALSLLAVGGAITLVPDMHRYLVLQQRWLTEAQFNASIAIAQAAPGPNVLFIGLMGWNVGLNAAGASSAGGLSTQGAVLGLLGMGLTLFGMLLPSTVLTWLATRWAARNRGLRSVRAFKQGMAPLVVGLLLATAWTLGSASGDPAQDGRLWALSGVAGLVVWRTRIHLLWLLAVGAVLGAFGWV
ncbi:chromate transporter [Curvibacter sp. HBC61]|uniref:Chromate transporter n=1 Tax=Curvibacter cyanobacteriorum TaxID=3026422 RepID=A0ABT5MTB7_9BURK|nr:chromate transporter [Curvibacter sp. HBC61]MDD0837274.1 chromate transporter [Curvibacter sp. HBC61]